MAAAECLLTIAAIVAPSALLTFIVRRWYVDVPWRVALLFLLLSGTFLWRGIFTSALPVPVDEASRGYPYEGVVGRVTSANPLTNDTTRLFLPWMQVVREELRAGRAPLWNRYSFSGYPLLGNGESAPFYPGFLATLMVPLPRQIVAIAGLKLFSGLLFAFLLIRREQVSVAAACFGAIAYAFSTFQTVYLFYSTTAVTLLLPAAVYALLNAIDRPERRSSLLLVASIVAVLQTAGHPESVFHSALGAAGFLLIEAIAPVRPIERGQPRRAGATIALGTVCGLLLSAPAWLPVLEQVRLSSRYLEISSAGRPMTPPFPLAAAWALLNPDLFGNPARGSWNWVMNYSIVASSYLGLLPLALLPSAVAARSSTLRGRLLAVFAIATFLLAMNWTWVARAANAIPPLSLVANDKFRFVTSLVAAVCAARVVDRMARRIEWIDVLGISVLLAAIAGAWSKSTVLSWHSWAGIVCTALFWIVVSSRTRRNLIPLAAAIFTTVELLVINMPFNAAAERRFFKPRLPIIDTLAALRTSEPFRTVGQGWTLMPNGSALYGIEDIRGSDPMSLGAYTTFLSLVSVSEPGIDVQRVDDLGHPAIDFLNVRYALAAPGYVPPPRWLEIYRGPDGVLLQNAGFIPRFFVPRDVVRRDVSVPLLDQLRTVNLRESVVVDGLQRTGQPTAQVKTHAISPRGFAVTVDSDLPLFVASSQPLSPGWSASTARGPLDLQLVNGAFIGFALPAGKHEIELVYRPLSFYGSVALTALALAILGLAGRRRTTLTTDSDR